MMQNICVLFFFSERSYPQWIVYNLALTSDPFVAWADTGWKDGMEKLHCKRGRRGQLDCISLHLLGCQLGAHYLIFSLRAAQLHNSFPHLRLQLLLLLLQNSFTLRSFWPTELSNFWKTTVASFPSYKYWFLSTFMSQMRKILKLKSSYK